MELGNRIRDILTRSAPTTGESELNLTDDITKEPQVSWRRLRAPDWQQGQSVLRKDPGG